MKRTSILSVSSIRSCIGLHRTIQLQLLQNYWPGHRLGLLWYWMVCLGNEQRSFHHFWVCIQVLHSIWQQIWKTQLWPQDWKRSIFIPIPKKGNAKECSNYHTIALISHASKIMLKILQARLQQYVDHELPGFRKGRGTRDQIANICWIIKKAREFQENIYFCFIYYAKAFDSGSQETVENSERDGTTRPPDLPLEKPLCRSGSNN